MSVSPLKYFCRHAIAVVLTVMPPVSLWAQEAAQSSQAQTTSAMPQAPSATRRQFEVRDYSKPKGHFPNPVAPYTPSEITPPDLNSSTDGPAGFRPRSEEVPRQDP